MVNPMGSIVKIYISLLEEGTPTARPTQAENLGDGTYKILTPEEGYNPEDELWEFLPGTVVRCKLVESIFGDSMLLAAERVAD